MCLRLADTVKSLLGVMNGNSTPVRFHSDVKRTTSTLREERPQSFVSAIQESIAAAESSKNLLFREIFCIVRFSTFATWGNSGIEPDKGKGISSPGT